MVASCCVVSADSRWSRPVASCVCWSSHIASCVSCVLLVIHYVRVASCFVGQLAANDMVAMFDGWLKWVGGQHLVEAVSNIIAQPCSAAAQGAHAGRHKQHRDRQLQSQRAQPSNPATSTWLTRRHTLTVNNSQQTYALPNKLRNQPEQPSNQAIKQGSTTTSKPIQPTKPIKQTIQSSQPSQYTRYQNHHAARIVWSISCLLQLCATKCSDHCLMFCFFAGLAVRLFGCLSRSSRFQLSLCTVFAWFWLVSCSGVRLLEWCADRLACGPELRRTERSHTPGGQVGGGSPAKQQQTTEHARKSRKQKQRKRHWTTKREGSLQLDCLVCRQAGSG